MARLIRKVEWHYTFTCGGAKGCGSQVRIKGSDVRYAGGPESAFYAICPSCGTHNVIPIDRVPDGVAERARSDYYA
jgi:hypothetical protein